LKLFADIAAFTSDGRLFQMAAPEYINDLRKSSQFGCGICYMSIEVVMTYVVYNCILSYSFSVEISFRECDDVIFYVNYNS